MVSRSGCSSNIQARYAPTTSNPVPSSSPMPPAPPALSVDETASDLAPPLPPRPDQSMHVRRPSATSLTRVEDSTPSTSAAAAPVGAFIETLRSNAGESRRVEDTVDQPSELGPAVLNESPPQQAESEQAASTAGAEALVLPPGAAPAALSNTNDIQGESSNEKEIMAVSNSLVTADSRFMSHPRSKTLST